MPTVHEHRNGGTRSFCCTPYWITQDRPEAERKHAMNCARHCTDEQHAAVVARLAKDDTPHQMYGIEYPRVAGDIVTIHDPNAASAERPQETYTYIAKDGATTYSREAMFQ